MSTSPTFPAVYRCLQTSVPVRAGPQQKASSVGSASQGALVRAQGWWVDGASGYVWLQIHSTQGPVWTCMSNAVSGEAYWQRAEEARGSVIDSWQVDGPLPQADERAPLLAKAQTQQPASIVVVKSNQPQSVPCGVEGGCAFAGVAKCYECNRVICLQHTTMLRLYGRGPGQWPHCPRCADEACCTCTVV